MITLSSTAGRACLLSFLLGLSSLILAAPAFPAYRELAVYTTSAPDAANPAKIIARTQFVNRGENPVRISARLQSAQQLGFRGASYAARLQPGQTAVWTWSFTAPEGFAREVLAGEITLNGRPERDLFLTVLGTDPADINDRFIEKIAERARVVATFAPRQRRSVLAELAREKANRPDPVLTLAAAGKTDYAILTDALPAPPEGKDALEHWRALTTLTASQRELIAALEDLRRAVRLKTDAVLPIRALTDGPAVILRTADPGPAAAGLQDAYRLRTAAGGNVVIEAKGPDGLRNGVYGLLTDHLDCHWFMPGQLGEEIGIPADRAARLPALDEVQGSKWLSASGSPRNRASVNRGRMNFGHAWFTFVNKQEYPYDKFPHYYARDREGKLRIRDTGATFTNFCSTEPEVIEIVARKVNAFFAAHPDAIVASLDPNDYAPMCLCDRCLALDRQYGQTKEDGREVSDRLLHFSKEIYDRLEPRFKDRYLGILVYGFQMAPPITAKGHPQHVGLICDMFWTYDHTRSWNDPTSTRNQTFHQELAAWGGALSQLGYYEYIGNAEFFGPWPLVQKIREDLPAFYELGGTFLQPESQAFYATQGPNLYISDRLSWNLDADADLLMEEFYTRFYGPAAEPMRAYWQVAERLYTLERPGSRPDRRIFDRPASWEELDKYLAQAGRIAAALPPAQRRFADRVQFARDGLEYGRLTSRYQREFQHQPADHAAAIAFLKQHGPRIAEIAKKYPSGDPYWPPLAPGWAIGTYDVDRLLERHENALKTPAVQ
jgi:hypothetical protein